jgi:dihydroorotate dehydrogenase
VRIDSPTEIAGVTIANKLMNGAYIHSKTLGDIKKLIASGSGAVVVGSISVQPRSANLGQKYWRHKQGFYSLNSYGMPNGGMAYFKKHLPVMVEMAHEARIPLIANIVGFSKEEFADLVMFAKTSGADMVELNLGCPNVWDRGKQEEILSYNPVRVSEILQFISKQNLQIPICVKLSPLPPELLKQISTLIAGCGIVKAVTATNSYPNALTNSGTKVGNEEALAGLSGRSLKPISLGVVKQLRSLLPSHIDIIGCGGISTMNDVLDYMGAGAKAVQIATALIDKGTEIFEDILHQT